MPELQPGIYERVVDEALAMALDRLRRDGYRVTDQPLDQGDSDSVLAAYVAGVLRAYLSRFPEEQRLSRQVSACNQIVGLLDSLAGADRGGGDESWLGALVAEPGRMLTGLEPAALSARRYPDRPDTPLAQSFLFTGATDPALATQLRKEFATADRVDILCSFIKWSGVRILADEIRRFLDHRAVAAVPALRVITTSYIGATDPEAVRFLAELIGAEVKVSYDTERTRLHAKAYVFHRNSGFGTAYVGSSNLSRPAMSDGLEWNVKVSQYESAPLWRKITATFETYWNDDDFVPCQDAASLSRLTEAIQRERQRQRSVGSSSGFAADTEPTAFFDIRPYPFQEEILGRLMALREFENRRQNLIVAATGTGKTVIAGFDYRAFRDRRRQDRQRANLLFVAHREEILRQSQYTFRTILQDHNFGDLCFSGAEPTEWNHLFVSIQTLNSRRLWEKFPADWWDYIVVDEFHHAAAPIYQEPLTRFQPVELLGLTATPERHDGEDILKYFGGAISAEIRLPDAIRRRLLCPFQYFGIPDPVDLSHLTWSRGYVIRELESAFGTDTRAGHVLNETIKKIPDLRQARGLGFCASVRHAAFMAQFFTAHGVPAMALSGETHTDDRRDAQRRLEQREINFLFVVDLYNEGVDLPFVDTLLFLRPTESLTAFLQQFGRGLRVHREKEYLTVLDFIGQAHEKYNFEPRFRARIDRPRHRTDHKTS